MHMFKYKGGYKSMDQAKAILQSDEVRVINIMKASYNCVFAAEVEEVPR